MSQFFKALEQAERDRLRQDGTEVAAAPQSGTMPADKPAPTAPSPTAPSPTADATVADKPVAETPVARTEPPTTAVPAKPPQPAPRISRQQPAATETPRPVTVFRESLRRPEGGRAARRGGRQPLLIAQTSPNSIEAEAYRTLRANIELMANGTPCRHIAITSAAGGDGKSTTAANLAVVAAQAGHRVCVVDADVRRPTLHDVFGLRNVDGLVAALQHGQSLQAVAQPTDIDGLSVVVAGRGAEESAHDLVTSQRLDNLLRQSEGGFDLIVFDSPPVTGVADALSLAAVCDGVVLVVRARSLPFSVLKRAVAQVTQVKGRVLGVLLNRVDLRENDSESYGYVRAYHSRRPNEKR